MAAGLIAFFNTRIAELKIAGKLGNARVYRMARMSFESFLNHKEIALPQINFKWLKNYETWFLAKGNKINGLSVNLRTLRALLNQAIKRGMLDRQYYPFDKYSIAKETTRKRAISEADIEKIKNYPATLPKEKLAKDIFLISYYLMGASFVDLAFLKLQNIGKARVKYKRKKTGVDYDIKVVPTLKTILEKYTKDKESDDFLLPTRKAKVNMHYYKDITYEEGLVSYQHHERDTVQHFYCSPHLKQLYQQQRGAKAQKDFLLNLVMIEETEKQHIRVRTENVQFNEGLKAIAKACGIEGNITSYVARHSFATVAKFKNVPVAVISQALGHKDLKTTETYLAEFDTKVMDGYLEQIVGGE